MEPFYLVSFIVLAIFTCLLEWFKSTSTPKPYQGNKSFLGFRDNYLMVYSLMMGAASHSNRIVLLLSMLLHRVHRSEINAPVKPFVHRRAAGWCEPASRSALLRVHSAQSCSYVMFHKSRGI